MSTQPLTAIDVAKARYKEAKDVTLAWEAVACRKRVALDAETDGRTRRRLAREIADADDQVAAAERREYEAYLQIEGLRV